MKTRTIILSVLCLCGLPAFAGTTIPSIQPAPYESPWSWRVALYGWGESLDGTVGVRGYTAPMHVPFSDLVKNIQMGAMGAVEVKYNRWGFTADMVYASLGDTLRDNAGGSLNADLKQFLGNFVVSYDVVNTDVMKFDVYAGARVNWMDLNLKLVDRFGVKLVDKSGSESWVDPIIGLRFQHALGHDIFFRAVGDIGGFGVSSQFTWQAMAGFGYSFHEYGSLLLGYRALGIDYTNGGFTYDVTAYGPVIGYEWKF